MPVINPFRTSFDFSPRVHPDPWPDYFSLPSDLAPQCPLGITQRWALTVTIAAQGEGTLLLTEWALPVHAVAGGIVATVAADAGGQPKTLNSGAPATLTFLLDVQKLSLEDRRAASADVALSLSWRRTDTSPEWPEVTNTTLLPVPRLPVPGSEPRVLAAVVSAPAPVSPLVAGAPLGGGEEGVAGAPQRLGGRARARTTSSLVPTAAAGEASVPGVLHLQYVLENPTNYFLTFSVVMEASEGFAFSGPKQTVVQVLPVARVALGYRLFVYRADAAAMGVKEEEEEGKGEKGKGVGEKKAKEERRGGEKGVWVRPALRVVDRYFNKTLRVSPGSEGVGLDKNGVMVWVPTEEVEE